MRRWRWRRLRGDRMALRFDTSLRCGRTSYDVVGRTRGAFDGRAFSAAASRRMRIAGGRKTACNRKQTRRFTARVAAPAPAGAPRPAGGAAFGGLCSSP